MPLRRVAADRDQMVGGEGREGTCRTIERAIFGTFVDNFVSTDVTMF
jgi:hypothetical protein